MSFESTIIIILIPNVRVIYSYTIIGFFFSSLKWAIGIGRLSKVKREFL